MNAAALATHAETCTQCAGAFDGVEYAGAPAPDLCPVGTAALQPRLRPILFSGPMVRALLAGKKTQTRRVAKSGKVVGGALPYFDLMTSRVMNGDDTEVPCPYGVPGDRLWVRETWCSGDRWFGMGVEKDPPQTIRYAADNGALHFRSSDPGDSFKPDMYGWSDPKKWRPSIFMPRWASRITLEVTDVRVERVQDISEEDAKAEGVDARHDVFHASIQSDINNPARRGYAVLWDSINGKRPGCAWADNPYAWAVSFRVVTP